jgi:hypothetical protein
MKDDKEGDAISHSIASLQEPGGLALSDSEKADLADNLEAQLQQVNDASDPGVIEIVNEAMCAYKCARPSGPKLTSPSKSYRPSIRGLKVGKAPGPNGISNRVLRHLPKRVITFLTKVFNALLLRQY